MALSAMGSIRMIHPTRLRLLGKRFSQFQQIIQNISISIRDSILNFRLFLEDEMLVSEQQLRKVVLKYGLVLPQQCFSTFAEPMLVLGSEPSGFSRLGLRTQVLEITLSGHSQQVTIIPLLEIVLSMAIQRDISILHEDLRHSMATYDETGIQHSVHRHHGVIFEVHTM